MRFDEALRIIAREPAGFLVGFDTTNGNTFGTEHFPEWHVAGARDEPPIRGLEYAQHLAESFAAATVGKCFNVRVLGLDFRPIENTPVFNRREWFKG